LNAQDDKDKFKELYGELGEIKLEISRENFAGLAGDQRSELFKTALEPIPEKGLKGRPLHVAST
jgi:hypothetical protein